MAFSIETVKEYTGSGIKCALFDFDGTISLIREGWQGIMIPYFCEVIKELGTDESDEAIYEEVREFVDRLTGKQTIFQCIALDEAVVRRGGEHREPIEYKNEYLRRLEIRISDRKKGLKDGSVSVESCTVKGAFELISKLKENGIKCYLASGTDEKDVIYEASLIGLADAFDGGIHGARDGMLDCSKEAVIKNMISNEGILPEELISFGDGFVEIELVATLGGYAVGVATNEKTGEGIDEWKRERLLSAGANCIIPNFEDVDTILRKVNIVK